MENQEKKNTNLKVIIFILILIIITSLGWILFKEVSTKSEPIVKDSIQEETKNKELTTVCTKEAWESRYLKELELENKTQKIGAIGGSRIGYNVTTTVTKDHNYTSTPANEELYAKDYEETLFILYKNKLYYTSEKEIISKYCETREMNASEKLSCDHSKKLKCDYSKFNDDSIKEFNALKIDGNLKTIGSYGSDGSCSPKPYAITDDGKVISITKDTNNNYSGCEIMYDDEKHPIDRIFNMSFYDGIEYTILLKDGTLITRDVDREHPIELEH